VLTLLLAMRCTLPALLLLAACSGGEDAKNSSAPAPKPTGPAPKTPVTSISPEPGKSPTWMGVREGAEDPKSAPYSDVLDQPVVNAAGR
jgi:hypothetical protein